MISSLSAILGNVSHLGRHPELVKKFMDKCGQEMPLMPKRPSEDTLKLRADLILEEALETIHALGFDVHQTEGGGFVTQMISDPDMVEIVDGCCDLNVVSTGTLISLGVSPHPVQLEVDYNNLMKFDPSAGGYRRDDGKWVKSKNHPDPRIPEIIKALKS